MYLPHAMRRGCNLVISLQPDKVQIYALDPQLEFWLPHLMQSLFSSMGHRIRECHNMYIRMHRTSQLAAANPEQKRSLWRVMFMRVCCFMSAARSRDVRVANVNKLFSALGSHPNIQLTQFSQPIGASKISAMKLATLLDLTAS
jgi:hypothetical protein